MAANTRGVTVGKSQIRPAQTPNKHRSVPDPRPLLFRQIPETNRNFYSFLMRNYILGHLLFRRSFFGSYFRIMSNPSQKAICSSRNKSQMAPNETVFFHEKLGLRSNTWSKSPFFDRRNQVFAESMKERGATYEHFPLCGSAWAAIWGQLLKK